MKLFCAIVGVAGSAFSVDIDQRSTVAHLKEVIKATKPNDIMVHATKLHLSLAKKRIGMFPIWLRDNDPVALRLLKGEWFVKGEQLVKGGPLQVSKTLQVIPPWMTLRYWFYIVNNMPEPSSNEIHVLVTLPDVPQPTIACRLAGPVVNLFLRQDLLAFMEGEMSNEGEILSSARILDDESLQFHFVGREKAIDTVVWCFSGIVEIAKCSASDHHSNKIPVCNGISGIGKTRILEEGGTILRERMKLDAQRVFSVIVPYSNGFRPLPVEDVLPIKASFSWRLLYRFFLHGNCSLSFEKWFESRLPVNGGQLSLQRAVAAIGLKLRSKLQDKDGPLYLFLGIDDYQVIDEIQAELTSYEPSLLRELVVELGELLCQQSPSSPSSSGVVLLPMFAGTVWGAIEPISDTCYLTPNASMPLLTMDQIFQMVGANASYAKLLSCPQICRDLLTLGSVPQWSVEYLKMVNKTRGGQDIPSLSAIKCCFEEIWTKYVAKYLSILKPEHNIRLAAAAIAGQPVSPRDVFDGDVTWATIRDSSLCLLFPQYLQRYDVQVPYVLLQCIGSSHFPLTTETERAFAKSLADLKRYVDDKMIDGQSLQSWEMFSACFYAVRINALLVLGYTTVPLEKALGGAVMDFEMNDISVKLVPSRVFLSADAFGASTPSLLSEKDSNTHKTDWTLNGYVVVSGDDEGVDIFFALEDANKPGKMVVIVDQRRQFGVFEPTNPDAYMSKVTAAPMFLDGRGARVVRRIINYASTSTITRLDVPPRCFIVTQDKTNEFYGTLLQHPACTPSKPQLALNY